MPDRWVVNASPVITLAKAGHLALLTALATEVLLPEAVVAEVLAGPVTDPARQAVEEGWGTRVAVPQVPVSVLEWGLGAGETAVLAVALARGNCTAIRRSSTPSNPSPARPRLTRTRCSFPASAGSV